MKRSNPLHFRPNKEVVELLYLAGWVDLRSGKIRKDKINMNGLLNEILEDYLRSPRSPLHWQKVVNADKKIREKIIERQHELIKIQKRVKQRKVRQREDETQMEEIRDAMEKLSKEIN